MAPKILVISPIPTHPQNAGNRTGTYILVNMLKSLGCEVHFLCLSNYSIDSNVKTGPNFRLMKKKWDKVYILKKKKIKDYLGALLYLSYYLLGLVGKIMKGYVPKAYHFLKPSFPTIKVENKYLKGVDSLYPAELDRFVKDSCDVNSYNIVIAEYIFMSRALELFPDKVLKVIDTNDIFTDRSKKVKNSWFSVSREEEARGLNRADLVIAVQDDDAEYFREIVHKRVRVVTVGRSLEAKRPPRNSRPGRCLLFVGSHNEPNTYAINFFTKEVLPIVRREAPKICLLIAGYVCRSVRRGKGYRKLGEISNIDKAYDSASIVVAPVFNGTGLKIKVVEALGHGKVVVATSHAAIGLEKLTRLRNSPLLIANTPKEFASQIKSALHDGNYDKRVENAYAFIKDYNKDIEKNVRKILEYAKKKS